MRLFLFFFIFNSCKLGSPSYTINIIDSKSKELQFEFKDQFSSLELEKVYSSIQKFINTPKFFLKKHQIKLDRLKKISLSPFHCTVFQLACTYSNQDPSTIYLNHNFISLIDDNSRVATLIHELYHLNYDKKHIPCKNDSYLSKIKDECDEDLHSAYGLEFLFLKEVLGMQENDPSMGISKKKIESLH